MIPLVVKFIIFPISARRFGSPNKPRFRKMALRNFKELELNVSLSWYAVLNLE